MVLNNGGDGIYVSGGGGTAAGGNMWVPGFHASVWSTLSGRFRLSSSGLDAEMRKVKN